jgi:hypothetical protein
VRSQNFTDTPAKSPTSNIHSMIHPPDSLANCFPDTCAEKFRKLSGPAVEKTRVIGPVVEGAGAP